MMTAIVFATFIAIVWWAYSPSRKRSFEEQGRLGDDS